MALVLSGSHSSGPSLMYQLYADQVGGSGNTRTIKLTLNLKCAGSSSSWYGYPMNWRGYVNGAWSGWMTAKGTESWRGSDGWRSFYWTYTTDVGTTSSKAITVGFGTDSYSGDNSWDSQYTGSFTVGSTNTAPTLGGAVTTKYKVGVGNWVTISSAADGPENQIKIPENADYIRCEWPSGGDDKGEGGLTYYLFNQQNESSWSQIYSGRNKYYEHNIGAGNEGRSYDYYVYCRDAEGAQSPTIDSLQFQKNQMGSPNFTSSSSIAFDTTTINFSRGNASNTNGNSSFTYQLRCDGISVYNPSTTSTTPNIKIWRTGESTPSTSQPYVKFDDIKNKFKGVDYKGSLNFTIAATNEYGTTKVSGIALIPVNLQTPPIPVQSGAIQTKSPCYKTVLGDGYYIPDSTNGIIINWTGGSGKLGETFVYEIYVGYGDKPTYTKIGEVPSTVLTYTHNLGVQSSSRGVRYLIKVKTSYGSTSDFITNPVTLHYYKGVSISLENIVRGSLDLTADLRVRTDSSITGMSTVGSWVCTTKSTSSNVSSGSLKPTQYTQELKVTNLEDDGQYTLTITYKDNTGLSTDATYTLSIGANLPVAFINKYGLGVGGVKADGSYNFKVKGSANIEGVFHVNGKPVSAGVEVDTSKLLPNYGPAVFKSESGNHKGLTIQGTNQEIRMWTGSAGSVIENTKGVLYLGTGDTYTNFAIRPEGVTLGRDLTVGQYLKINAWPSYGSGSSNIWFSGNDRKLTLGNTDVIATDNSDTWKSIDFYRGGARVRYGIGHNDVGPSPSIEYFEAGRTAHTSRLNISKNALQFIANDTPSCWIGFYSGNTRCGYVGRGSNGDNIFRVYSEIGDLVLSTNYRIQATGHFHAGSDNTFYLGLTSPAGRWKQLCAVSSAINTSDHRYKHNIKPIKLTDAQPFSMGKYRNRPYKVAEPIYGSPTSEDYYNFVKDELELYEYEYIMDSKSYQGLTHDQLEDAEKGAYTIGFIADDYETLAYNKVAQQFIFRSSDGVLNYNTGNYVNVLANALKVASLKIEALEEQVKNLTSK